MNILYKLISICILYPQTYCSVSGEFERMITSTSEGFVSYTVKYGDLVKDGDEVAIITNPKKGRIIVRAGVSGQIREFLFTDGAMVPKNADLAYIYKLDETQKSYVSDEPNIELE